MTNQSASKSALIGIAILISLAISSLPGFSHVGSVVFPVYELPSGHTPSVDDGSIEDWEELVPGASITTGDFTQQLDGENATSGAPPEPDDLATRVFLGWSADEQRIYVAVERLDDSFIGIDSEALGIWSVDRVIIRIDGDHSADQYSAPLPGTDPTEPEIGQDEYDLLVNSSAQEYQVVTQNPFGPAVLINSKAALWLLRPPWIEIGGIHLGEQPNYSVIEMAVTPWDKLNWTDPEASVRSDLYGGKTIGLMIGLADYDVGPNVIDEFFLIGGSHTDSWRDASFFVDAVLLCARGDCAVGSSVEPDSWARIKASLSR